MKIIKTKLEGVVIIEPKVFKDDRGFFTESFHASRYCEFADIKKTFVQDNRSRSKYGVLRGLHFQKKFSQDKLVHVTQGDVFDVAIDINPRSSTFGKWEGVILNDNNFKQFYIPAGYAHGFCVLSEFADFQYKCTEYYHPEDEVAIYWDDPFINIDWPLPKEDIIVSSKDLKADTLNSYIQKIKSNL